MHSREMTQESAYVVGPERLALPGAVSLLLLEEGEVAAVWKETDRDPGVVHNPSP